MKKAFTLIELIVVIVIIGTLAVVAVPKFISMQTQAREAATRKTLDILRGTTTTVYISNKLAGITPLYPLGSEVYKYLPDNKVPENAVNKNNAMAVYVGSDGPATEEPQTGWGYNQDNGRWWAMNDLSW